MKLTEAMIAWTPETDRIKIGPWPDESGWSDAYEMTAGACASVLPDATPAERILAMFLWFHSIVVEDHVPPQAAHQAFLAIDEYRANIASDISRARTKPRA